MKKYLFLFFILSAFNSLSGQNNFEKKLELGGIEKVIAEFQWGDVILKNYEGSELQIVGTVAINLGENNDAFVINSKREGNALVIGSTIKDWKSLPHYVTMMKGGEKIYHKVGDPKNINHDQIRKEFGDEGYSYSFGPLIDIELTLLVPQHLNLDVETEYGSLEVINCINPMELKSIYGHLIAHFENVPDDDCNLESTYSFVDVTIPEKSAYNLTLMTNHGEIYSNLDISIDRDQSINKIFESKVIGALNRGGTPLTVKAIYNNIYLRKKS